MDVILNYIPALVALCVFLVVVLCEIIKAIDKKERLKVIRPYIPAVLGLWLVGLLAYGGVVAVKLIPFYWLVVTGSSVFFYDAILEKIKKAVRKKNENS